MTGIVKLLRSLLMSYSEFHSRATFKLPYSGLLGLLAHPVYYILWAYVIPQPFESLTLRLVSMVLCLALAVEFWWPRFLRPYYLGFSYIALMLCLPIFFTYMLLKNGSSEVWVMSATVATLLLVLLYDFRNALLTLALGNIVAVLLFFSTDGVQELPTSYVLSIPVYVFAISAVGFLTYSERQIAEEKLLAAQALAANIAHEMRTPLLGIRLDCDQIMEDLRPLLATDQIELDGQSKSADVFRALERVQQQSSSASAVIDMLLFNVKHSHIQSDNFAVHSMRSVVETAVSRFPFRGAGRASIILDLDDDFEFFGSEILMMHVFFNLIKNALSANEGSLEGYIAIKTSKQEDFNVVTVSDNGRGIDVDIQNRVFTPFATKDDRMEGTGLGLSFCKNVVTSFGGEISFRTMAQNGTSFSIKLPVVKSAQTGQF